MIVVAALTFTVSASEPDAMSWESMGGAEISAAELDSGFLTKSTTAMAPSDVSRIADATVYEVQRGDTLSGIASKYSISVTTVRYVNNLYTDSLKPGQKLTIIPVNGVLHKVGSKETVATIATKYKVTSEDIMKQNKLVEGQDISSLTLIIPGGKPVVIPRRVAPKTTRYNVTNIYKESSPVAGLLLRPCAGVYTQYYSWKHRGIDIADPTGPTIYTAASGTVIEAHDSGWNGGYGKTVVVDHGGGLQTRYAHMRKVYIAEGDQLMSGQAVGLMGSTGRSTGTHLHFEVLQDYGKKNPVAYF